MTVNIPLLRKVVELAEQEWAQRGREGAWTQGSWLGVQNLMEAEIGPTLEEALGGDNGLPKGWEQYSVVENLPASCGTTGCVAGHAALMAGAQPVVVPPEQTTDGQYLGPHLLVHVLYEGRVMHVENAAARALGITFGQQRHLFAAENSIEDVREIAEEIAGCPL